MKRILGLGNALVDILIRVEDEELLKNLELSKGVMTLIQGDRAKAILQQTAKLPREMHCGGSAANTITGLARLGLEVGYLGRIGNDSTGDFFLRDMEATGITPHLSRGRAQTGTAICLITPDGERTMATHLGSALELDVPDLIKSVFREYDFLHIEGYLVQNHKLIEAALCLALDNKMKISLDLSSANVVREQLDFLRSLLKKYVHIVFANEEEAQAFCGQEDPRQALAQLAQICAVAVVKTGKQGSLAQSKSGCYEIACYPAQAVDTTGAGDLYAAGFLYGLSEELPLPVCGRIGSLLAGKVVEAVGAKLPPAAWKAIKDEIFKIPR